MEMKCATVLSSTDLLRMVESVNPRTNSEGKKEKELLKVKSEQRAAKWPNTIQVRSNSLKQVQ